MNKFPITHQGAKKMEEELKQLKHMRPEVIQAIATAREQGDLSENAEYHAAREKQGFIEGRIAELENKISRADIIDFTNLHHDTVTFGATVELLDEDTNEKKSFSIVGEYESDISKGLISNVSPLAEELIGKRVGDIVEVNTPRGLVSYEILSIQYKELNI
ncbi:transcription elongation factor GreA [Candidatus Phycorickettsia trachydisci]|uniref:Transcription elongation factor GreA n=1 Tax=Candidatus Phycorickettsia trachydisci TaxID=2115978 RepID=A0A2P1P823_9RICK|nr:transcription elongation factor GreA [Candidatus Phycorickettsia trachydisci]AVP87407.1 transcription elongation factor GreA [Candidatus Phycorickettsia trachydisci]